MSNKTYEYYLTCDISELNTEQAVQDILLNPDKYEFIYFCQEAPRERSELLLTEENIGRLLMSKDAEYKVQNGVLNGFHDIHVLNNTRLCEFIHLRNIEVMNMMGESAIDYLNFLNAKYPEDIFKAFRQLFDDSQLSVLKHVLFDTQTINDLLRFCKEKSCQYLVENDFRISLDDAKFVIIEHLASSNVEIPLRLLTEKVIHNITTIDDVNAYRFLVDDLSVHNDVSMIETERKKYYEEEIQSIGEDGLLPEYRMLKEGLSAGASGYTFDECLGSFHCDYDMRSAIFRAKNMNEAIKQYNDYKISNMILDYLFDAIPSSIIMDIEEMLHFQEHCSTLSETQRKVYTLLANIDRLDAKDKIRLFQTLKDQNMAEQFYDDYARTKEKMVEVLNQSILNEETVKQYKDEERSQFAGVPVYVLRGQKFKAFIRCWGKRYDAPINPESIESRGDALSFSIDSSELLKTFESPKEYYTICYSNIPSKQVVHAYPTDSFTKYFRNRQGIPDSESTPTSRVVRLMSPDELASNTASYNEILLATPNSRRINSEFDNQLEEPKPLAIYCYDHFTPEDVESAKALGVGIIVVDTSQYEIDNDKQLQDIKDYVGRLNRDKRPEVDR